MKKKILENIGKFLVFSIVLYQGLGFYESDRIVDYGEKNISKW